MKLSWKHELFALVILAVMAAIAIYYYPLVPDMVVSHHDIHGNPNGWIPKTEFYLIVCASTPVIYLLFTFLPLIDPFKKKIEMKFKIVLLLRDVILVFFVVVTPMMFESARDGRVIINSFDLIFGLVLIVVGNFMPKMPQNFFIGIRTPWTISSEVVWKKTHVLGGWLVVLCGFTYAICGGLQVKNLIPLCAISISLLVSVAYSFYIYKKIEKGGA